MKPITQAMLHLSEMSGLPIDTVEFSIDYKSWTYSTEEQDEPTFTPTSTTINLLKNASRYAEMHKINYVTLNLHTEKNYG